MKKFWIGIVIWVAVLIAGLSWLVGYTNRNVEHDGTKLNLEVSTERYLDIKSNGPVTLEAASPNFFVLRKESGEVVVATPAEVPLGWTKDEYFTAGPVEIPDGRWIVEQGSELTLQLSSQEEMKLLEVKTPQKRSGDGSAVFLIGLVLTIVGAIFLAGLFVDD